MSAKGTVAKEQVINTIKDAFGSKFIGVFDKKAYVWAEENGEKLQIAISLTCPKVFVGNTSEDNASGDFQNFEKLPDNLEQTNVEISESERRTIEDLMSKLGL